MQPYKYNRMFQQTQGRRQQWTYAFVRYRAPSCMSTYVCKMWTRCFPPRTTTVCLIMVRS